MNNSIILASDSAIKLAAASKVFTKIKPIKCGDITKCAQPFGMDQAISCMQKRYEYIREALTHHNQSTKNTKLPTVVLIESFLEKRRIDDYYDIVMVCIIAENHLVYAREEIGIKANNYLIDSIDPKLNYWAENTYGALHCAHLRNPTTKPDDWNGDREERIGQVMQAALAKEQMTCLQLDDLSTFQDWPKKGVLFQDVMQIEVLPSCNEMIAAWAEQIDFWMKLHGHQRYALAGVDFRGALFAGQLKMVLKGNHPLLIVRKKGKIPDPVKAVVYKNEYKDDELEVSKSHLAEIPEGMPFVIIDDILATGGTLKGVVQLLTANGRKPEEMFGTFVNDVPALRNVRELNGVEILLHKSKL